MTFRYRLREWLASEAPELLLEEAFADRTGTAGKLADLSRTGQWTATFDLLRSLGAKTLLVQSRVRDPDFLAEHQAYYARQHRSVKRYCYRVHAFRSELAFPEPAQTDERRILAFLDAAQGTDAYIGFVTIRPVRHAPVGPTIITPPHGAVITTADHFPVHIAGNEFEVRGTPFLQQDSAVAACAQASIWMALRTLRRRHGNSAYSPAELTSAGTRFKAPHDVSPGRSGLSIEQMLEAIRFAGYSSQLISFRSQLVPATHPGVDAGLCMMRITPYLESGLPVVLALNPPGQVAGHAVAAIGLRHSRGATWATQGAFTQDGMSINWVPASNWVPSLVIHNDNTGPYLDFTVAGPTYTIRDLTEAIAILPEGVWMNAEESMIPTLRAFYFVNSMYTLGNAGALISPDASLVFRTILCTRHAFRKWAKEDPFLDDSVRDRYRTHELPKYLWVTEIHDQALYDPTNPAAASKCGELVLDASGDPNHGDLLQFARVTRSLWSAGASWTDGGFVMSEDDRTFSQMSFARSDRTLRIAEPWDAP